MLNYFNVYMYVPGTSYQTLNENIFLSCVLMRTIFPKSLFTQIWIKKLRNHATRCSLRKQSPLLVLHCKERSQATRGVSNQNGKCQARHMACV